MEGNVPAALAEQRACETGIGKMKVGAPMNVSLL
jgi:hypothetical protein